MTDKTPDIYQDAIHKLMDYLNDTVVFAKGQLPDVANQMLVYGAEMAHIWMICWIIAAVIAFLMFFLMAIFASKQGGGASIVFFLIWIACSIACGNQYSTQIEIRDAPKLYIMEQIKNNIK